jgi:hypothetical protein
MGQAEHDHEAVDPCSPPRAYSSSLARTAGRTASGGRRGPRQPRARGPLGRRLRRVGGVRVRAVGETPQPAGGRPAGGPPGRFVPKVEHVRPGRMSVGRCRQAPANFRGVDQVHGVTGRSPVPRWAQASHAESWGRRPRRRPAGVVEKAMASGARGKARIHAIQAFLADDAEAPLRPHDEAQVVETSRARLISTTRAAWRTRLCSRTARGRPAPRPQGARPGRAWWVSSRRNGGRREGGRSTCGASSSEAVRPRVWPGAR